MDAFFLILILILFGLLITGGPIFLSVWIYKFIKKRTDVKILRLVAILPVFLMGWIIFTAIYPRSPYYKKQFENATNIEFPKNANFLTKASSYPDIHGDYYSFQIVKTEKSFLDTLENHMQKSDFTKGNVQEFKHKLQTELEKINLSNSNFESYYFKERDRTEIVKIDKENNVFVVMINQN